MMKIFGIFLLLILLISCSKKYSGEINFKGCKIAYPLHNEEKDKELYGDFAVSNQWEYESAMQKLAICLCEKYIQKPDPEIKEKIIEIYKGDFEYYRREVSFKKVNFDSVLANRKVIFDPSIFVN
ncbi:hypothetical protein GCM10023210_00470 [Chryseobacterium ginsengisoli]|uniref:Lipoprotein n=1 Tax=Chryseobacterium ginsengisoli TaxID=363853 RepID=A0ABP9LSB6_9FLAO